MTMWLSWLGRGEEVAQDEVKELTKQFYVTLRAAAARLDKDDETRSPKSFAELDALLATNRSPTWTDAYQIEQLLVDLFSTTTLEVELQSRLLEAASSLRGDLGAFYVKQAAALKTPADRRALLARLVNDLQWRYTVNEVKRTYTKGITRDTGMIFIGAILVFGAAFVMRQLFGLADRDLLLVAGLAGGWGAAFSMLATLRSRLDAAELNDLKRMRSRWLIWSRPLIGAGAACILYFFLVSGLLSGTMFPDLSTSQPARGAATVAPAGAAAGAAAEAPASAESKPGASPATVNQSSAVTAKNLALLVVWCFIAGFSEQLVPTLVAKTENRLNGQPLGPERFKPGPADGGGAGDPPRSNGGASEKKRADVPA
jgi:hypothetical protein